MEFDILLKFRLCLLVNAGFQSAILFFVPCRYVCMVLVY